MKISYKINFRESFTIQSSASNDTKSVYLPLEKTKGVYESSFKNNGVIYVNYLFLNTECYTAKVY